MVTVERNTSGSDVDFLRLNGLWESGQAALLLRYDVPTLYVSRELLAAALRTELPDDMVFAAIPFPFDALVFMLPTYMPEAKFNVTYYKSVPLISGATIKERFNRPVRSRSVSSLMMTWPKMKKASICRLRTLSIWLLSTTLLLIMISGEELVERGRLEKVRKPKSGHVSGLSSGHRISSVDLINPRLPENAKVTAADPAAPLASRAHQISAALDVGAGHPFRQPRRVIVKLAQKEIVQSFRADRKEREA